MAWSLISIYIYIYHIWLVVSNIFIFCHILGIIRPNWLIVFKMVEITNHIYIYIYDIYIYILWYITYIYILWYIYIYIILYMYIYILFYIIYCTLNIYIYIIYIIYIYIYSPYIFHFRVDDPQLPSELALVRRSRIRIAMRWSWRMTLREPGRGGGTFKHMA